jgi:hypothetical protein
MLQPNSRSERLGRAARCAIEPLESRVLLSASGWAALKAEGNLAIGGTARADVISVGLNGADANVVDVTVNGALYQFNRGDIASIGINAYGGKDYIRVDESNGLLDVGIRVRAGGGADRVVGGSLDDNLFGGEGNDYLVGNGGNDTLAGAGGNDKMWGGLGGDWIKGAGGNDWLVGGYGNDALYGDNGADWIDSGEGDDTFYGGYGRNEVNTAVAKGMIPLVNRPDADYSGKTLGPAANIATPQGYTPTQIRNAYEFGNLADPLFTNRGQGQAVAVVIAWHIPTAAADLQAFSDFHGLGFDSSQFEVVFASGAQPIEDPAGDNGWATEANLDLQWVHAIAPEAKIYLVEADSNSSNDIDVAIRVAAQTLATRHGGGVVNMSLGSYVDQGGEIGADLTEAIFRNDSFQSVSFVAASGDSGARPAHPATSPSVLAVGGTAIQLDATGNRTAAETPWDDGSGGYSQTYGKPIYQIGVTVNGVETDDFRVIPDVSYNSDPATAVSIYTSFAGVDQDGDGSPDTGWVNVGGTSAAAPQWSGLVALANQVRAENGFNPIGSQITAKMYALGELDQPLYFNDINTGQIGPSPTTGTVYEAYDGFDIATGWGTPRATNVIAGIADASISGAQLRGFRWGAVYSEAVGKYPGGQPVLMASDFRGSGRARFTTSQMQLALSIEQQYNGQLLQITFPTMERQANDEFRGIGIATLQGPLTGGLFKVAVAGRVYVEEGISHVVGSFDAISPITGQLPVDGQEETFRGWFNTKY